MGRWWSYQGQYGKNSDQIREWEGVMGVRVSTQVMDRGESAGRFSPVCCEGHGSHEAVYLGDGGHRQEEPEGTDPVLHLGEA